MANCCTTSPPIGDQQKTALCPHCDTRGRPVGRQTVEALVKSEVLERLNGKAHVFCATPTCPVVYYSPDGGAIVKEDVRVRVGIKETKDPIPVCYCFVVTKHMIHEEVEQKGHSTLSIRIRAEVKGGNCRCEVESPSGRCCLSDVIQAEKQALVVHSMRSTLPHLHTSGTPDGTDDAALSESVTSVAAQSGQASPIVTAISGVVAAFLASLCCIEPVVFAVLGVGVGATGMLASTAGFLKALLPYRPWFIGLTAGLLGLSFYLEYRSRGACATGRTCLPSFKSRVQRTLLWIATATALALVVAPYWLGL